MFLPAHLGTTWHTLNWTSVNYEANTNKHQCFTPINNSLNNKIGVGVICTPDSYISVLGGFILRKPRDTAGLEIEYP